MRDKVPLLTAFPMELGGEVFTMGLALKLQKVPPGSGMVDFTEFRRENSNTATYASDWDSYQVSEWYDYRKFFQRTTGIKSCPLWNLFGFFVVTLAVLHNCTPLWEAALLFLAESYACGVHALLSVY
uniref:Uncharacterized protein n=1 Tax=Anopheles maculatus TaxID=74869 RepID=A0A182SQ84_9DIPT